MRPHMGPYRGPIWGPKGGPRPFREEDLIFFELFNLDMIFHDFRSLVRDHFPAAQGAALIVDCCMTVAFPKIAKHVCNTAVSMGC